MTTQRKREQALLGRNEALGMVVSCIGAATVLAFISPQLLVGSIGFLLGGVAILASLLTILFHVRQGGAWATGLLLVLLVGGLTAGSLYGTWWYFTVHLAAQPNLWGFGAITSKSLGQPMEIDSPRSTASVLKPAVDATPIVSESSTRICGAAVVHEVEALALRAEPTRSSQQLAAIERGNLVDLLCESTVRADDREWYKVRYSGLEGWMSARYLHVQQP